MPVQANGASPCVVEWAHGDSGSAGGGGRGRAPARQQWVRFGGVSHVGLSCRARLLDDRSRGQGRGQIARAAVSVGWRCRQTALQIASSNGHTETAKALVAAGADVHRQDDDGYGRGVCVACGASLVSASARRQVPGAGARRRADRSHGNGCCLPVQANGASPCVVEWAHGDSGSAGGGGRGRAPREQQRVRSGVCRMWRSLGDRVCSTTGPGGRGEASGRSLARQWAWACDAGKRR